MKVEAAIRKILGPGSDGWLLGNRGFLRAEGVEVSDGPDGKPVLTWGTQRKRDQLGVPQADPDGKRIFRAKIYKIFTHPVFGFFERARDPQRPHLIRFDAIQGTKEPGLVLIPVFEHFEAPKKTPRFAIMTIRDPRVAALCEKDRGPLIIPQGTDPVGFLRELHWVAA